MDPSATVHVVASMARIDKMFEYLNPASCRIVVDRNTPLQDAYDILARMKAGVGGVNTFQVVNPELVLRKEEAMRRLFGALARMDSSIINVQTKIEKTGVKIAELEEKIALGPGAVDVGPPIIERGMDQEQVIYPHEVDMPDDETVGPERQMSYRDRVQSKEDDGASQVAFWQLNLIALRAKLNAQIAFRDALLASEADFERLAMQECTVIGSGHSDYTFSY